MTDEDDPLPLAGDPVAHAGGWAGDFLSHVRCSHVRRPSASDGTIWYLGHKKINLKQSCPVLSGSRWFNKDYKEKSNMEKITLGLRGSSDQPSTTINQPRNYWADRKVMSQLRLVSVSAQLYPQHLSSVWAVSTQSRRSSWRQRMFTSFGPRLSLLWSWPLISHLFILAKHTRWSWGDLSGLNWDQVYLL